MIQIKGFGIAAATLLNIDYKVAIFLVYLFILYSTFEDSIRLPRRTAENLIMLTISIVVVYFVVVGGIEGSGFLTNAEVFNRNAAGSGRQFWKSDEGLQPYHVSHDVFWLGYGAGNEPTVSDPIVAAKSRETARKVLICSLVFLTFFISA